MYMQDESILNKPGHVILWSPEWIDKVLKQYCIV